MDLSLTIAACAAVVLAAKGVDFLLGKAGRQWVKDRLIFQPWYFLQGVSPLALLRASARVFSNVINRLFGDRLISYQALTASWLIGVALVYLYVPLDKPLGLSKFVDYEPSKLTFFGTIYGINPCFDFIAFGITRYLARRIAVSNNLLPALTLWLVDFAACAIVMTAAYSTAELFVNLVAPKFGLSIWYGHLTHDLSVFTAVTGFVPTLIHLGFFLVFLFLTLIEMARVALSFILERFDEANESPLTVVAALVAAIMGLLSAVIKMVSRD